MVSKSMFRFALLLFVIGLAKVVAADQLKLVCNNDKKVELTRASELAALVEASSSQPDDAVCSSRIRAAIVELDQLVNSDNDNVCSPAKINQIRAYYAKFVDKKSPTSQHEIKLPKALRDLFLSFGFGVSRLCKTSMISSLMSDAQSLLNEKDFEQISTYTSDSSPFTKMMKAPKDVDDLVLPKEISALLSEKNHNNLDDNQGKTYISLQSKAAKLIKKVQSSCQRRFRPIYEQLILPLVSLSRIGLNYKGDELGDHLEQMRSNKYVHQWYRIVFVCELVLGAEVFEESDTSDAIRAGDKKRVRILTSEEADELRASQLVVVDEPEIGEKINYQVSKQHKLDDLIVKKEDKNTLRLVQKFEAHKSELNRIRSQVVRQTLRFIKQFLKNSKVSIVGSLIKRGSISSLSEQLLRIADEYIGKMSDQDDQDDISSGGGHVIKKRSIKFPIVCSVIMIVGFTVFLVLAFG